MKFEKDYIIEEIIRTAKENGGTPLGKQRFASETGIKESHWTGIYWMKWSDAVKESGFVPNTFQLAYGNELLLIKLIELIKELGRLPTSAEILLKNRQDKSFPSVNAFRRLGKQNERIKKIIEYSQSNQEYTNILEICIPLYNLDERTDETKVEKSSEKFRFVYLVKSGRYYKIGRSNDAERRAYELRLQMPEKLELIHKIRTDDSIGIEEYWHKRFKDKRKNGEWFELTRQDVEIFKRRKFM